ncbi:MAG: segregation/condensation protein A [Clostridia bacterium]|nr:segregation/condensation protein A [Clostridia bacterium]
MEQLKFSLEVFDGPLELLLHLISKNKVSIYDIPISLILEQYMDYIEDLKKMDLEVSSAFIEMAAQLMLIKSRMLLPKAETEEEDPRMSLAEALAEYKRYKKVIGDLRKDQENAGITYVRRTEHLEFDKKHKLTYETSALTEAYRNVLRRSNRALPPPLKSFAGIVGHPVASVPARIIGVLRTLKRQLTCSFRSLFKSARSRSEIVATFLAVLELSKSKHVEMETRNDDLYLTFKKEK